MSTPHFNHGVHRSHIVVGGKPQVFHGIAETLGEHVPVPGIAGQDAGVVNVTVHHKFFFLQGVVKGFLNAIFQEILPIAFLVLVQA